MGAEAQTTYDKKLNKHSPTRAHTRAYSSILRVLLIISLLLVSFSLGGLDLDQDRHTHRRRSRAGRFSG